MRNFALKDTIAPLFNVVLFGGSILIGRPILRYFLAQALGPDTKERREAVGQLMGEKSILRSLIIGTIIITIDSITISDDMGDANSSNDKVRRLEFGPTGRVSLHDVVAVAGAACP